MSDETESKQITYTVRIDQQTYDRLIFLSEKNLRSYGKQFKALVDKEFTEVTGKELSNPTPQATI